MLPEPLPTWRIVKDYLIEQIATGIYPVGSWLPSVRNLADQLSINRNTVSKVYQSLANDGYLQSHRGKGVQVISLPDESVSKPNTLGQTRIYNFVRETMLAGVKGQTIVDHVVAAVKHISGNRHVRLAFIECTDWDTRTMSSDISKHLGIDVSPLTLLDYQEAPSARVRQFDLVATTFFHLQEVRETWPTGGPELLGINHTVSHASLLEISQLPIGGDLLIVGQNDRTIRIVEKIVGKYVQGQFRDYVLDAPGDLQREIEQADAVINASDAYEVVAANTLGKPLVRIAFHIDMESLDYLRSMIQSISRTLESTTSTTHSSFDRPNSQVEMSEGPFSRRYDRLLEHLPIHRL